MLSEFMTRKVEPGKIKLIITIHGTKFIHKK
jgi:hypothetical protein